VRPGFALAGKNEFTVIPQRLLARAAVAGLAATALLVVLILVGSPSAAQADWVRDDQWQLQALNAPAAWRLALGTGVTVAVLDSGVDGSHHDLKGRVLPGVDLVDGSTDGRVDFVGHGTTVAALIAGRNDDGAGVAGIAPGAKILPIRVLDRANKYDDAAVVAKGLRWAVDHGAQVVNMSLGGSTRSDVLAEALAYAAAKDVVVIACAGNVTAAGMRGTELWYPAREPGVVAVAGLSGGPKVEAARAGAATGTARAGGGGGGDELWAGSLTGPQTVLSAPAVNMVGARPGGYWRVQGTSFAAPLVAATATLVRSRYPGLSAPNVINRLIRTAHDLGPRGRDDRYGYGEVDPVAALSAEVQQVAANPLTTDPEPATTTAEAKSSSAPDTAGNTAAGNTANDAVTGTAAVTAAPAAQPLALAGSGRHDSARAQPLVSQSLWTIGSICLLALTITALAVTHRRCSERSTERSGAASSGLRRSDEGRRRIKATRSERTRRRQRRR
jgi:subtilisin family serine protease